MDWSELMSKLFLKMCTMNIIFPQGFFELLRSKNFHFGTEIQDGHNESCVQKYELQTQLVIPTKFGNHEICVQVWFSLVQLKTQFGSVKDIVKTHINSQQRLPSMILGGSKKIMEEKQQQDTWIIMLDRPSQT